MNEIRTIMEEALKEENPEALFADGFDDAIIGICRKAGESPVVAYSYDRCVEVLTNSSEMFLEPLSYESALEWMEFNVVSAYMGKHTPVFIDSENM
jgi:hypothetical protein